jgi:hypothetical protein
MFIVPCSLTTTDAQGAPSREISEFMSALMRNKKLNLAIASAAFHIEQVKRNAVHSPLLMPASDAALFSNLSSGFKFSTPKDGPNCIICGRGNHPLDKCYDIIKAKEICAERQKTYNKDQRACHAAGTGATALPIVEAALATSLHALLPPLPHQLTSIGLQTQGPLCVPYPWQASAQSVPSPGVSSLHHTAWKGPQRLASSPCGHQVRLLLLGHLHQRPLALVCDCAALQEEHMSQCDKCGACFTHMMQSKHNTT